MDVEEIVDGVRRLEPGETGSWPAATCKRTLTFLDPQALLKALETFERPILDVEVYHKPKGGGFVAHVTGLN